MAKQHFSHDLHEKVDAWFNVELARYLADGDTEAFKGAIKDKLLESYRNGRADANEPYYRSRQPARRPEKKRELHSRLGE